MKYFFGWENIKHVLYEVYLTFSNRPSELSSKRIERGVAFITGIILTITYIFYNLNRISPEGFLLVNTPLFAIAGYILIQTQKEKKETRDNESNQ